MVVAPWVAIAGRGRVLRDHDRRQSAVEGENPNTRGVLDRGLWIDDVPELPGAPPWPELAADRTLSVDRRAGRRVRADAFYLRGCSVLARASGTEGRLAVLSDANALDLGALGVSSRVAEWWGARRGRTVCREVLSSVSMPWQSWASSSRPGTSSRRASPAGLPAHSRQWYSRARLGTALRGTSWLHCWLRSRSPDLAALPAETRLRRSPLERRAVELLDPRHALLRVNCASARSRPAFPIAAARERFPASATIASASARGRLKERHPLVVGDYLGQAPDRAGNHRARSLHRLERDHAEALAERGTTTIAESSIAR